MEAIKKRWNNQAFNQILKLYLKIFNIYLFINLNLNRLIKLFIGKNALP